MLTSEITSIHFDMDGVIVDSEALHVAAEQQTCVDHKFAIDPTSWGGFKGQTARAIFEHLIEKYGDPVKHDADTLIAHKTSLFLDMATTELQPIPGVIDFLTWAREEYSVMNLVTSSNRQVQEFVVEHLGIAGLFDHVITGDDVRNGKPHPEPYLRSIARSNVRAKNALVIEDSKSGVEAGIRAGCMVLAVTTSHPMEELQAAAVPPTFIAEDYTDAQRLLITI